MLEIICSRTNEFIQQMPKALRKKYGQFFTSKETARYMASLFCIPKSKSQISILDAGAGSGILSIALIERLSQETDAELYLTCYENDPNIYPLLVSNLEESKRQIGERLSFEVRQTNYILSQRESFCRDVFADQEGEQYDLIIGNPPYMKIAKEAPEAVAMSEVCHGAPNLYFLFAAMGVFNLKDDAEMVYIIPRSWTSGAYFEQFRKYLFSKTVLTHIHLFGSRKKVFEQESVLQETMIIKIRKTHQQPETVRITTSPTNHDFNQCTTLDAPYSVVISGRSQYVYLVTNDEDVSLLNSIGGMTQTLPDLGFRMKTGLVVDFRTRESLRNKQEENAVPLIYSQHIKDGRIRFPGGKENEYLVTDKRGLIQENKNYLFVKRFTAKEEPRRLQCGIYLKRYLPDFKFISTQNKINFIDCMHEISECVIYGLYVLFNSTMYDLYYRILNGSTQVNSSEMNSVPVPSLNIIEQMGKELIRTKDLSENNCNQILRSYIS